MKACFSLVGRTRFELVTNGLKAPCARLAKPVSPLGNPCTERIQGRISPLFCQNLPTKRLDRHPALWENAVVNAWHRLDNSHRAETHAFSSPLDGQVVPHGKRSSLGFALSGRCFVEWRRGKQTRESEPKAGELGQPRCHRSKGCARVGPFIAGVATGPLHKASSSSGRALTQRMGLHGPHPHTPAATTNRYSRPALGKGSGLRFARDGVTGSARSESNCPTVALGLELHRSGVQMEKAITHITLPKASRLT